MSNERADTIVTKLRSNPDITRPILLRVRIISILKILSARRRMSIFLTGLVCLVCSQAWLTARLLEQDRNLELQRSRERLEEMADLAVAQLSGSLGDWDLALHELNSLPPSPHLLTKFPSDATFILISAGTVSVYPHRPLVFVPEIQPPHVQTTKAFEAADLLELREKQYDKAIGLLQPMLASSVTRPEALLRIARIERKADQPEAALETYKRLGNETAVNPSGTPYPLLAGVEAWKILTSLRRTADASREASELRSDLLEGRWPIRRELFQYYWSALHEPGQPESPAPPALVSFATLVSDLQYHWLTAQARGSNFSGRSRLSDSTLLVWNATSGRVSAMVTSSDWLRTSLKLPTDMGDVHWRPLPPGSAIGTSGRTLSVTRSLADVQLLGYLEFSNAYPFTTEASSRRTLLLGGAGLMLMVVVISGYAFQHGINQELRVARLQSNFVNAVSHEFRSPLTTLRTITELLAQGRIHDEERRQQSYIFLDKETNRLHRLVEDLLDFGRWDSDRKQFRMESLDIFSVVVAAVDDLSELAETSGFQFELNLPSTPARVLADKEAFRRALRNLVENAMKYSPVCRTVWIDGEVREETVFIAVRDHGMGIDPQEQRGIFHKFVRGSAAIDAGIKGTGIGLSMVHRTCKAFKGRIRLQSEVGAGSTFTIELPLAIDSGKRKHDKDFNNRRRAWYRFWTGKRFTN